ncbi:MAG: Zn-ribbon domain-containing OB-fold protein [Candidatus Bathyarchaeia archaeon]
MTEELQNFTIEQFYKYVDQKKLMGGKCLNCGKIHLPPRPICNKCLSTRFEWIELPRTGKLLTYTIIHVAPTQFQNMTPYAVGIIQLEDGINIPGIIRNTSLNDVRVGMELKVEFEDQPANQTRQWPKWSRYYFVPC